jgi:hypothetical protein
MILLLMASPNVEDNHISRLDDQTTTKDKRSLHSNIHSTLPGLLVAQIAYDHRTQDAVTSANSDQTIVRDVHVFERASHIGVVEILRTIRSILNLNRVVCCRVSQFVVIELITQLAEVCGKLV